MDKDRSKGVSKKVTGTIKEKVGKVTGNKKLQNEGKVERGGGKVQEKVGQTKDEARHKPHKP